MNLKSVAKNTLKSLVVSLCILIFVRLFIWEPFRIPSGSMIPTLSIGDFIMVNRLSYGLKKPILEWFGHNEFLVKWSHPRRGDVVVFKNPKDHSMYYVKRIIGIPGDKIEVMNTRVSVNGKDIAMKNIAPTVRREHLDTGYRNNNFQYFENEIENKKFITIYDKDNYYKASTEPFIIPKGEYFMMGDNRDYSQDSRFWGTVKEEEIKGKAMFVWFSLNIPDNDDNMEFKPYRIGKIIN